MTQNINELNKKLLEDAFLHAQTDLCTDCSRAFIAHWKKHGLDLIQPGTPPKEWRDKNNIFSVDLCKKCRTEIRKRLLELNTTMKKYL